MTAKAALHNIATSESETFDKHVPLVCGALSISGVEKHFYAVELKAHRWLSPTYLNNQAAATLSLTEPRSNVEGIWR